MQHVIVRHAIFFLEKYGSLAVWSCQGMENSHHAAKTTYSGHTQHSGGKLKKKNPLLQTFQHWFRIVGHRFRNKETEASNPPDFDLALSVEAKIQARREASINSSSTIHSAEWRERRIRKGS